MGRTSGGTGRAERVVGGLLVIALVVTVLVAVGGGGERVGAATTTLTPAADVSVNQSAPKTKYGRSAQLAVGASPVTQGFWRFDLRSIPSGVTTATLRLHVDDVVAGASPSGGTLASSSNTGWNEANTVWGNRPTIDGATIATLGAVTRNAWTEVDVTDFVAARTGSLVTFALTSTDTDAAIYDSRETGATAAQLLVTAAVTTSTSTTASTSTTSTSTTTTTAPPSDITIAAVGDMACAPGSSVTSTQCRQGAISDQLLADPSVTWLLALGDLQYENGELTGFQQSYDPSYGRMKAKTKPVPGNHEYNTAGATGYYGYFGSIAGDPTKGYYSFDVGSKWHIVALNSNCSAVACSAGSTQEQWLRADLAASTRPCTIAYWHHPRFSSGLHGNNAGTAPFWDALAQDGAEIVLGGHDHDYEAFAPQTPGAVADANGIREFVVGGGGRSLYSFGTVKANSAVRLVTFGYLKLALGASGYSWQYVAEGGSVLDSGSGTCH
ncbi:MAG: DNRLRE domain-containing protein [Actinomycetota bacterium]